MSDDPFEPHVKKEDGRRGSDTDDIFKRLMELKEMYKQQREELVGDGFAEKRKIGRSTASDSSENEVKRELKDVGSNLLDLGNILGTKKRAARPRPEPDVSELQSIIAQVINDNGGSCHVETIVEYVRLRWPNLRRRDGTPYNTSDCRKAVQANLRSNHNNRCLFVKDEETEGCWLLAKRDPMDEDDDEQEDEEARIWHSDDENIDGGDENSDDPKPVPQCTLMLEAIEDHGGSCHLEDIYAYVLEHWIRPISRQTKGELTDDQIKEGIRITLRTDPRFCKDPNTTEFYMLSSAVSQQTTYSPALRGQRAEPERGRPPERRMFNRRAAADKSEPSPANTPSDRAKRGGRRSNSLRSSSPPPGYRCPCGATEPGRGPTCKWRKGPRGEFLCNSCGLQWSKKHACPVCGKVYRRNEANSSDDNSWIRCDDCHRWVMTKCDGITDLSIYDDDNPNHLHYSCPICRTGIVVPPQPQSEVNDATNAPEQPSAESTPSHTATSKRRKRRLQDDPGSAAGANTTTNNNNSTPNSVTNTPNITAESISPSEVTEQADSLSKPSTPKSSKRKPPKRRRYFTARTRRRSLNRSRDDDDEGDGGDGGDGGEHDGADGGDGDNGVDAENNASVDSMEQEQDQHQGSSPLSDSKSAPEHTTESKVEVVERELLREWHEQKGKEPVNLEFAEQLRQYKNTVQGARDSLARKRALDLASQVDTLRREKETLDQEAERELSRQLRQFYDRTKEKLDLERKRVWAGDATDVSV